MSVAMIKYILSFDWLNFQTAKHQNRLNKIIYALFVLVVASILRIAIQFKQDIEFGNLRIQELQAQVDKEIGTIAVAAQKNEELKREYQKGLPLFIANQKNYARRHNVKIKNDDAPSLSLGAIVQQQANLMSKPTIETIKPSMLPLFTPLQVIKAQMPDLTKFTESGWVGVVVASFVLIATLAGFFFKFLSKTFSNQKEMATSLTNIHTIVSETKVIIDERLPRNERR